MAKPEFFTAIRRAFAREFTLATQPDHPYLISGPDVLMGRDGVLVALFTPKAKERQSPTSLLIRLTASRLALPVHTRFLLLLGRTDESLGNDRVVVSAFDEVFQFESGRRRLNQDLIGFVQNQGREPTRLGRQVVPAQQRMFSRSIALIEESRQSFELGRKRRQNKEQRGSRRPQEIVALLQRKVPVKPIPWSEREQRITPDIDSSVLFDGQEWSQLQFVPPSRSKTEILVWSENGLIGTVDLPEKRSPMEKLSRFFDDGLQSEFTLDNGVPYLVRPVPKVLFVESPPTYKLDPPKPVRVMAFSGWALVEASPEEDPDDVSQRVFARVRGLQL